MKKNLAIGAIVFLMAVTCYARTNIMGSGIDPTNPTWTGTITAANALITSNLYVATLSGHDAIFTGTMSVTSITWPDGTVQVSSPTGGGTSGGASIYPEINFTAGDFTWSGITDTASIITNEIEETFDGVVSSCIAYYVRFPNTPRPNAAYTSGIVPRSWVLTDATTVYMTVCTTSAITGLGYFHVSISSNPAFGNGTGAWATTMESTVTLTGYSPGSQSTISLGAIAGSGLVIKPGNRFWVKWERYNILPTEDIWGVALSFGKN